MNSCYTSYDEYGLQHLPRHLLRAKLWIVLEKILTDLDFIETKCTAGMIYELQRDYESYRELRDFNLLNKQKILKYSKFVNRYAHILHKHADQTLLIAANLEKDNPVSHSARKKLESPENQHIWFDRVDRLETDIDPTICSISLEGKQGICCAVNPFGTRAVVGDGHGAVKMWQTGTWKYLGEIGKHESRVMGCAFSPDSSYLITTSFETTILWNVRQEIKKSAPLAILETPCGYDCDFSPCGCYVVIACGNLELWDIIRRIKVWDINLKRNTFSCCCFSSDGKKILAGSLEGSLGTWSVESGKQINNYDNSQGTIQSCDFSPDGQFIAAGCVSINYGGFICIWEIGNSLCPVERILGHLDAVKSCCFSPDGKLIASASCDHTLNLWEIKKVLPGGRSPMDKGWRPVHTSKPRGHWVNDCVFAPDGTWIISCSDEGNVIVEDVGRLLEVKDVVTHKTPAATAFFSPDDSLVLTGAEGGSLLLWHAASGTPIGPLIGHEATVDKCMFMMSSGKLLTSDGKTTLCWNIQNGRSTVTCEDEDEKIWDEGYLHKSGPMMESPDGRFIAHVEGNSNIIYIKDNINRASQTWRYEDAWRMESLPPDIRFTPDSKYLFIAPSDGNIFLIDVSTMEEVAALWGMVGETFMSAFSADGNRLVLGDKLGRIYHFRVRGLEGELNNTINCDLENEYLRKWQYGYQRLPLEWPVGLFHTICGAIEVGMSLCILAEIIFNVITGEYLEISLGVSITSVIGMAGLFVFGCFSIKYGIQSLRKKDQKL